MDGIIEGLKAIYVALGGDADDVAGITLNIEGLRAIYVALGGDADEVAGISLNSELLKMIAAQIAASNE